MEGAHLREYDAPTRLYLGVDPGTHGALVTLEAPLAQQSISISFPQETLEAAAYRMPLTERAIWELVALIKDKIDLKGSVYTCLLEQVQGYIGTPHPGSAMFAFGQNYGGLRMALIGNGIRFSTVTPAVWQEALGVQKMKGKKTSEHKRTLKRLAASLYPTVRVTGWVADALLIAHYGALTR